MNLRKVPYADLKKVEAEALTISLLLEYFASNYYRYVYVYERGKLVDVLCSKDLRTGEINRETYVTRMYTWVLDVVPTNAQIQTKFENEDVPDRVAIIVNGDVAFEVENVQGLSVARGLYKSQMALRFCSLLKPGLKGWFANKGFTRLLVVSESIFWDALRKCLDFLEVDFCETFQGCADLSDYSALLDFKYFSLIRNCLISKPLLTLYAILEEVALNELVNECKRSGIPLGLFRIPMQGAVSALSRRELIQQKELRGFRSLIRDEGYLKSFASSDQEREYMRSQVGLDLTLIDDNGVTVQENVSSPYVNVINGVRRTLPRVKDPAGVVHVFGTCTAFGICVPDGLTMPSFLQRLLLSSGSNSAVINHGCLQGRFLLNTLMRTLTTPMTGLDGIVILDYFEDEFLSNFPEIIDTARWFNECKTQDEHWFFDYPMHCNARGNSMLACQIFNWFQKAQAKRKAVLGVRRAFLSNSHENMVERSLTNSSLYYHLQQLSKFGAGDKSNALVIMYASPFTLGHLHLVDCAAKVATEVFVFVISEWFHGETVLNRLDMVRAGLECYKNVHVLPSEIYFASKQYFPEYGDRGGHVKSSERLRFQEEMVVKYLCPALGIKYRFLGEEGGDAVTNDYNTIVRSVSESYGIECRVVPRIAIDGEVVSAKTVRKLVEAKEFSRVGKLVPKTTMEMLLSAENSEVEDNGCL